MDALGLLIDKLRVLAARTIPGANDLYVDYEDAARLLTEIDRLRAIETAHLRWINPTPGDLGMPPKPQQPPTDSGLPPEFVDDVSDPTDPAMPRW